MTTHPHRAPFRPFDAEARRRRRTSTSGAERPDHAPEVLLALAAVLVVLAGPVAWMLVPHSGWVAAGSAVLLLAGILLAVAATRQLLHRG